MTLCWCILTLAALQTFMTFSLDEFSSEKTGAEREKVRYREQKKGERQGCCIIQQKKKS